MTDKDHGQDHEHEIEHAVIAETQGFVVWTSQEEEGLIFHLELGSITLHFADDEWEELSDLFTQARADN